MAGNHMMQQQDIPEVESDDHCCECVDGCDNSATTIVWCDHHIAGCPYTGFRCDVHLNGLIRETLTRMARAHRIQMTGGANSCIRCFNEVEIGDLSDHIRYFRL